MDAKRKLYLSFALLIIMTLVVRLFGLFRIDSMTLPGIGFSSLLINAGLMMLTIRGYQWARIMLGISLLLVSVIFLISIFFSTRDLTFSLVLLLFFMVHGYIGNFLLRDRSIRTFVAMQKRKYQ